MSFSTSRILSVAIAACSALAGCSDSDAVADDSGQGTGPVYAVASNVYSVDDSRTVYVSLTNTLDVDKLDFAKAHEFPGVANLAAIGGRLLISDGEKPLITQYDISSSLGWKERATLRFDNFPLSDNANFFYQYQVDAHHMYMPFDGFKRIVWDPTDMAILEVKEDSKLEPERNGLRLEAAGNRGDVRYDGAVMQPFFYHDDDWFQFADGSPIAVYDPVTHEETQIIEAPCRGLAVASRDEVGNTYFSAYDYSPVQALYGLGPAACVVRVDPKHVLDEAFTQDFTALTGGRYSINFQYIRDGWGLADVFHHEELGVDFTGEVSGEVLDEIWNSAHWHVWKIDLTNGEAHPFDEIDVPGLGWSLSRTDGRTFLFVPYSDGARTRIYELDAAGHAREHLDVTGDAGWIRVR